MSDRRIEPDYPWRSGDTPCPAGRRSPRADEYAAAIRDAAPEGRLAELLREREALIERVFTFQSRLRALKVEIAEAKRRAAAASRG